jgi:Cys-tRNA(Pro)/Cys-tRNA(Cys) deacylase
VTATRSRGGATPALRILNASGMAYEVHEFEHDPNVRQYGPEAAHALGVSADRVFKTLVISVDGALVNAIVPVSGQLDLKALAQAAGGKRAELAGLAEAERTTGYVAGGVSPLGQRKQLPVVADHTIKDHETIFVSGGRRGLDIELTPTAFLEITNATCAKIATLD